MLCHALLLVYCVTLVNSFLLTIFVPPSLFLTFDNFHFWTLPYFLSVQNIAQSSAVLGYSYCGRSISEEKERSTSLRLLLGAVSIAL